MEVGGLGHVSELAHTPGASLCLSDWTGRTGPGGDRRPCPPAPMSKQRSTQQRRNAQPQRNAQQRRSAQQKRTIRVFLKNRFAQQRRFTVDDENVAPPAPRKICYTRAKLYPTSKALPNKQALPNNKALPNTDEMPNTNELSVSF